MPCASTRFPVKIDERAEAMKVSADNRDHERKSQGSGACERLRRAADAEPDWDFLLMRSRKYALAVNLTKSHSTQMFSIRYRISSGGTSICPRSKCNCAIYIQVKHSRYRVI